MPNRRLSAFDDAPPDESTATDRSLPGPADDDSTASDDPTASSGADDPPADGPDDAASLPEGALSPVGDPAGGVDVPSGDRSDDGDDDVLPDGYVGVFAGDCTVVYDGHETERHRGRVIVLVKPDGTVLVHDADGYQPAAWLTRADAVACSVDDGFRITARDGDTALRVRSHADATTTAFPVTDAGTPVGDCPDCGQRLVRVRGGVTCIGCGERYGLPAAATVTDETCSCGCPRLRVERGVTHDVCLDRTCEPLVDSVRAAFDREWTCPECGSDLRIVRRGDLLVGCDAYPDCEVAYSLPVGPLAGTCDCGLPTFDTPSGRRCLDTTCERPRD